MAFTDTIRKRFRDSIQQPNPASNVGLRELAKEIGVSAATLSRFLNGGGVLSDVLDKIIEWLPESPECRFVCLTCVPPHGYLHPGLKCKADAMQHLRILPGHFLVQEAILR